MRKTNILSSRNFKITAIFLTHLVHHNKNKKINKFDKISNRFCFFFCILKFKLFNRPPFTTIICVRIDSLQIIRIDFQKTNEFYFLFSIIHQHNAQQQFIIIIIIIITIISIINIILINIIFVISHTYYCRQHFDDLKCCWRK